MNTENVPLESILATISGSISSPSLSWIFFKADATIQSPPLNSCGKQNAYFSSVKYVRNISQFSQGFNVRKVISELYASFVLQCTESGR